MPHALMRPLSVVGRVLLNVLLVGSAVFSLARLGPFALPGRWTDFNLLYEADRYAWEHGWSHAYDPSYAGVAHHLAPPFFPVLSPPPALWVIAPLALLPQAAAQIVWGVVLTGAILIGYALVAPRGGVQRYNYGLAVLGLYTAVFTIYIGQVAGLVVLALALTWQLLKRGHEVAAGIALALGLVKPQLTILVPIALLLTGYRRAFLGWAVTSVLSAALSVLMLTPAGTVRFLTWLLQTGQGQGIYSIGGWLQLVWRGSHLGVLAAVIAVTGGAVSLVAAVLARRLGPAYVLAAGAVGSLIIATYIHFQDLGVLNLSAAMLLGAAPGPLNLLVGLANWAVASPALNGAGYVPDPVQVGMWVAVEWLTLAAILVQALRVRPFRPPSDPGSRIPMEAPAAGREATPEARTPGGPAERGPESGTEQR